MAVAGRQPRRLHRLEPHRPAGGDGERGGQLLLLLALIDLLVDGRPDHLPARVRIRLRLAGLSSVGGYPLHPVRRHRNRRDHRAVRRRLPGDVLRPSSNTSFSTPTTRSWRRRSTRGACHRGGAVDRRSGRRLRHRADPRRASSSGSTRAGGCCSCHTIAALSAYGWATVRHLHRREGRQDRELFVLAERPADPDVPGGRARSSRSSGLPQWAQVLGNLNPLYHCVELVRGVVFGLQWVDLWHLGFLVGFALVMWRLAIRYMERKLIL